MSTDVASAATQGYQRKPCDMHELLYNASAHKAHFFAGKQLRSHSNNDRAAKWQSGKMPAIEVETEDDAISLFPSEDILTAGQKSQGQDTSPGAETSSGSQELPVVSQQEEVLHRAAAALDIMLPEDPHPTSRFKKREAPLPALVRVPLLPDFEAVVLGQFRAPTRAKVKC